MAPVRVRLNFPQEWLKRLFFTGLYFISGCVKLYHNTVKQHESILTKGDHEIARTEKQIIRFKLLRLINELTSLWTHIATHMDQPAMLGNWSRQFNTPAMVSCIHLPTPAEHEFHPLRYPQQCSQWRGPELPVLSPSEHRRQ